MQQSPGQDNGFERPEEGRTVVSHTFSLLSSAAHVPEREEGRAVCMYMLCVQRLLIPLSVTSVLCTLMYFQDCPMRSAGKCLRCSEVHT